MKTEDTLRLKISLKARGRLSQSHSHSLYKRSICKQQLSTLLKRSAYNKKMIGKSFSSKRKLKKLQIRKIFESMRTREKPKKETISHPFRKLVSKNVDISSFKKFLKQAYDGAVYSAKHLEPIEVQQNIQDLIQIKQDKDRKILVLDLDQTLIHSVSNNQNCEVIIPDAEDSTIRMNVRPYVKQFLQNMSEYYHIYIFTASTQQYAQPILNYLDPDSLFVKGLLCRQRCVKTSQGCYVKDLRIFSSSSSLHNVIIIDNYVHSFGLQMQNGIPILPFQDNINDRQLKYVQKMLLKMKNMDDVRPFLTQMFQLRKLGEMKLKDLNI